MTSINTCCLPWAFLPIVSYPSPRGTLLPIFSFCPNDLVVADCPRSLTGLPPSCLRTIRRWPRGPEGESELEVLISALPGVWLAWGVELKSLPGRGGGQGLSLGGTAQPTRWPGSSRQGASKDWRCHVSLLKTFLCILVKKQRFLALSLQTSPPPPPRASF